MKKTFVALAVLAAFGSASAQVSVYGRVDLGVSSTSVTGKTDQGLEVTSGNYEGSRFGVKADHNLTGGLKASGKYEFSVDATGGDNAIKSNRVASIGLSGGFGSVAMGLQWTPYDSAWGFDQMEYNGFSAVGKVWCKGLHCDSGNGGNGNAKKSISYSTPDLNGFNATVLYSNSGDKTATEKSVPYLGLGANYATGPLSINFGYEQVATSASLGLKPAVPSADPTKDGTALLGDKTTAMIIGASYNLGVATIGAGYQMANVQVDSEKGKEKGGSLSVSVPVNASTTASLGYATETTTSAGVTTNKVSGFGAQVVHNWTKEAAVYVGAFQNKVTDDASDTVKTTKYAAGLRYNF